MLPLEPAIGVPDRIGSLPKMAGESDMDQWNMAGQHLYDGKHHDPLFTWWFIPVSGWVVTPVTTRLILLILPLTFNLGELSHLAFLG